MRKRTCLAMAVASLFPLSHAQAEDIFNVSPAALDQPRINAAITLNPTLNAANLLTADFGGGITTFNIQAYFDTGASGVLLSNETAEMLGIQRSTFNGQDVVFGDVGALGTENFNVSNPLYIHLAPFTPTAITDDDTNLTSYTQSFGPIRAQVGPIGNADPLFSNLDVLGIPVMHNKVVVMDPKPVNTFVDTMRTSVHNPGSALIPSTSRHVRLTKADFSPYTTITPTGAPGPSLFGNPFIGSNPITGPQSGDPPPVTIKLGSRTTTGDFLLDTGAAASMISSSLAADLHVRYTPGSLGTLNPRLEIFDPLHPGDEGVFIGDQFTLDIGGLGGTQRIAGFFLDSLTLPTTEGQSNANNNLRFMDAPVLVNDITLMNPQTSQPLTLDGIFGMNFLVASALLIPDEPIPQIAALSTGQFETIVYDDQNAILGLTPGLVPEVIPTVYWIGPASTEGTWNTTNTHWFDLIEFDFNARYTNGDDVIFTDLSDSTNITLATNLQPGSVTIESTLDHTFLPITPGNPTSSRLTGSMSLYKSGTGVTTFYTSNSYTGTTDIRGGTIIFQAPQNIGPVLVRAGAGLIANANQHFNGLRLVDGTAQLTTGGNKFIRVELLEISGSGQLNLGDGDLIINNKEITLLEDIRDYLRAGRNNGAWNGPGIMSNAVASNPNMYAIGYADNALLGRTTFHGEAVDSQSLIVQFTYAGDANLDGVVNVLDMYLLSQHWMQTNTFWYSGDFNYDGITDATDLGFVGMNWLRGIDGPLLGETFSEVVDSFGEAFVPEPAAAGLLMFGLLAGARRRRSRP